MLKRRNSLFILFLLNFLFPYNAFSQQSFVYKETLKWQITTKPNNNQQPQEIYWFDEGFFNNTDASKPLYRRQIALPANGDVSIFLEDLIWENVTSEKLARIYKDLPSTLDIQKYIKSAAFNPSATISFVPMRKHAGTGEIQLLKEFTLKAVFTETKLNSQTRRKKDVTESALAKGKWHKLGVTETGIYKVSQKYFRDLGFDANADVRNIKIYGKPGGMLPMANNAERDEDLVENAIQVYDFNNNNILDGEDYLLFYAKGPVAWKFNPQTSFFEQQVNYYSDTAYYFITLGNSPGKRILSKPNASVAGQPVTAFDDYAHHEVDLLTEVTRNVKSGREWFGEEFKSMTGDAFIEKNFGFALPEIDQTSPVNLKAGVMARAKNTSTFDIFVNGNKKLEAVISGTNIDDYLAPYVDYKDLNTNFTPDGQNMNIKLRYNKSTNEAVGWLDFLALNFSRNLKYRPGQFAFRDSRNTLTNNQYIIANAPQNLQVWDVTSFHKILKQEAAFENGSLKFSSPNQDMNEYVAFDGSSFLTPIHFGQVANQNLHGLEQPDMVIFSHKDFLPAAQRLADMRRTIDGFTVHIVTPQQLYNEFSSGGQDVSAIRDFMRMFYKRAEENGSKRPRYLLLLGDASYDYKYRSPHKTNFIPTFQGQNSTDPEGSYCSDDYFGFLDDVEGNWTDSRENDDLDIAIGRMPVQSLEQAHQMIDKIERYQSPTAMNDWRNKLVFIADDEDSNEHVNHADEILILVEKEIPALNSKKIYFDAYIQESSSSQTRYPAAKQEINNQMSTGALVVNYVGHGGELGLAHEKVVEINDITSWKNSHNYPLFITATCEFARFDDPERTSAGELAYLNPNGGAIAMYTTTRVVYTSGNRVLNNKIMVDNMFVRENGKARRVGDIFSQAKNEAGFSGNTRSFTLLGDPSLRLALPEYNVVTTKVNGTSTQVGVDTLKALSEATIYGEVQINGVKASDFNGTVYPIVYDKATNKKTLANDPGSREKVFSVRENILHKGKATVINGEFSFSFVVPKDISFKEGFGKLSFYAENQVVDAHGYYDSVIIGGSAENPFVDDKGPEIVLYMNDTLFKHGGLVNENPILLAKVKDDVGINTSGNGVGHDLVAVLNDGEEIILNDYYQANLNNYKEGEIRYPFHKLADGNYSLKVKVWDVSNNSAEAHTEFVVASSAKLALDKIFNYPNPFNTQTTFNFEHNRPGENLLVHIAIYGMNGQLIREIGERINTDGNRVNSITWDGRDKTGGEIASGIYLYKLTLKTDDGQIAQQSQRLVVIK